MSRQIGSVVSDVQNRQQRSPSAKAQTAIAESVVANNRVMEMGLGGLCCVALYRAGRVALLLGVGIAERPAGEEA